MFVSPPLAIRLLGSLIPGMPKFSDTVWLAKFWMAFTSQRMYPRDLPEEPGKVVGYAGKLAAHALGEGLAPVSMAVLEREAQLLRALPDHLRVLAHTEWRNERAVEVEQNARVAHHPFPSSSPRVSISSYLHRQRPGLSQPQSYPYSVRQLYRPDWMACHLDPASLDG